ncbi:hypothetical protein EK21DRAFT_106545 [Setomelanomma holmii]|uniref:Uncharacterized protein n=1 Tax=Setomelanomma holmii TaxID=210430 RepID=A0A9P4HJH0_9PLEO|nr:hypothetical protein EK21DRAFT_106545 [Setomelanomma holmii]
MSLTPRTIRRDSRMQTTYVSDAPALPTPFPLPPQCGDSLTMLPSAENYLIYQNHPSPAMGQLYTDCFPKEWVKSYLNSLAGTVSAGFSPFKCPETYSVASTSVVDGTITHGVCCQRSYSFHPNENAPSDRPFSGGTCFSSISSTLVQTYQNGTMGTIIFSATGLAQAYGFPIDGIVAARTTMTSMALTLQPNPSSAFSNTQINTPSGQSAKSQASHNRTILGIEIGVPVGVLSILVLVGVVAYFRRRHNRIKKNPIISRLCEKRLNLAAFRTLFDNARDAYIICKVPPSLTIMPTLTVDPLIVQIQKCTTLLRNAPPIGPGELGHEIGEAFDVQHVTDGKHKRLRQGYLIYVDVFIRTQAKPIVA